MSKRSGTELEVEQGGVHSAQTYTEVLFFEDNWHVFKDAFSHSAQTELAGAHRFEFHIWV